jgi:diacylglycerol kinase (ATP)
MATRPPSEAPRVLTDPQLDTIPPMTAVLGGVRPGLAGSFQVAIAGVLRTVATQRNMKIHVVAGLMVAIVGMALPLDLGARVALLFSVSIVFFAEILNTALEAVIDLFVHEFSRLAMLAKDAAAGGVLVFAVTTVFVLADILWTEWHLVEQNLDAVVRSCLCGIPLVLSEGLGLFVLRRRPWQAARLAVSLALLVPLVAHTHDPIFAIVAVTLIGVGVAARTAYLPRAEADTP